MEKITSNNNKNLVAYKKPVNEVSLPGTNKIEDKIKLFMIINNKVLHRRTWKQEQQYIASFSEEKQK